MDDDSADAGSGQIGKRARRIGGLGDQREARREQPFLRTAADAGDDYLAAVAFDLIIGQGHMRAVHREHRPRAPRREDRAAWSAAGP
jgi:hypothetical protein